MSSWASYRQGSLTSGTHVKNGEISSLMHANYSHGVCRVLSSLPADTAANMQNIVKSPAKKKSKILL